ncbi:MAG: response regulator [Gammaproteobacteria bacterium]|nr:response regulator [Gammaproteobacteria bacterium]
MAISKILVVDDSPADLINLREAVAGLGAHIVTATNGQEAVDKAKSEMPDVILMDIVMDGLDGYGACRQITRDPATSNIPVIFVSSKNQRADKMWAEKQGSKGMITKPYQKEDVLQEIRKVS